MEAMRLIGAIRDALAECSALPEILAEAWQSQALTQAIGGRLAVTGPPELRGEAHSLSEVGGRGGAVVGAGLDDASMRATQLSEVADARVALVGLGGLLGEVGIALVGVACAADEEGLYWQCIEAIDAADESRDRVRVMLRRLAVRKEGRRANGRREGRPPDGPRRDSRRDGCRRDGTRPREGPHDKNRAGAVPDSSAGRV
jgi:hypothetical protein